METIKLAAQYKGDKVAPFPSEDINQELKNTPEYFRAALQAMLSRYFTNRCAIPYDNWGEHRPFSELRAYRKGENNPNKYKDLLVGIDQHGKRKKSTINISWSILQILPQKIDVVKGYLQKINYDIDIQAIDYQSLVDKKTMISMAKVLADPRMAQMQQDVNDAAGRQVIQPQPQQFSSPEQVDVAAQVGVFFLEEEAALQNLLDKTQYESGSDGIQDLEDDDLITIGHSGKRVYTNPNTNIVMEDYVDVDRAIFPYSRYLDYRDASYGGEVTRYSIARLMQETDITDVQAIEIARKYSTNNGVGNYTNFYGDIAASRNTGQFGMNMWMQIEVDVVQAVWFGSRNVNITSVTRDKERNLAVNRVPDDYSLGRAKNKGKKLDKFSHQTVYKAKMVIGTDYVFDYGEDNDIGYNKDINGNLTPVLPYRFVRTGSSSLVSRCVGFVDDACLANYKLRVARSKMPAPPYINIDRSALEGMQIDGVKYKPQELMQLLSDEGFLITDSKNQWGNNNNTGRAVTPIGTDMFQVLTAWWEDMGKSIEMIEKVTGINDVFAAQTPQRQTGLGVSNLLIQGAQNALTPIIKAKEYITEQPWRVAAKKWQIVATYLPPEQRKKLSIGRSLEMVKIGSKMADRDFDLAIKASSNQAQIESMIASLENIRAGQRQGGIPTGLSEADFLVIFEMLNAGKLKQAQLYAAFAIDKKTQEAQAEQQQAVQDNAQVQQQSAQTKGEIDNQKIQSQGQVDAQLDQQKQQSEMALQLKLEILKGQNQRQAIILQNQLGGDKKSA